MVLDPALCSPGCVLLVLKLRVRSTNTCISLWNNMHLFTGLLADPVIVMAMAETGI